MIFVFVTLFYTKLIKKELNRKIVTEKAFLIHFITSMDTIIHALEDQHKGTFGGAETPYMMVLSQHKFLVEVANFSEKTDTLWNTTASPFTILVKALEQT